MHNDLKMEIIKYAVNIISHPNNSLPETYIMASLFDHKKVK